MSFLNVLSNYHLNENFFNRSTLKVAKELLGKYLVCTKNDHLQIGQILETEAYIGMDDLASHARFGKTNRNSIMWGHPGRIYVYLIYGIHHLINIITEPEDHPAAVLPRSIKIIYPNLIEQKLSNSNNNKSNALKSSFFKASNAPASANQKEILKNKRKVSKLEFFKFFNTQVLTELKKNNKKLNVLSPAKITQYFGLTRINTGLDLTTSDELFIADLGFKPTKIIRTPRIGIKYAGPIWSQKKWRFIIPIQNSHSKT